MKSLSTLNLSFGLLNLSVKVYGMRSREDKLSFSSLSDCCKSATKLQRNCSVCGKDLAWKTDTKGFKIGKNSFVELSKTELETIGRVNNGIEILYFTKASNIPMAILDKPYFLEADDNVVANKLYSLFNEVFAEQNIYAICRTTIKGSEHFAILRHDKKGIIMQYLEKVSSLAIDMKSVEQNPNESEEFKKIIKANTKDFNFSELKPIYTEKVKELIEAKAEGREIVVKDINTAELNDNKLLDTLKVMSKEKIKEVV